MQKLTKIIVFLIAFNCLHQVVFGQKIDSLHLRLQGANKSEKGKIYLKISQLYINSFLDSSVFYAEKAIALFQSPEQIKDKIVAYSVIAESYQKQQKLDEAAKVYYLAINLAIKNNEKSTLGRLYNGLGICYYYMNDLKKTKIYIKKAAQAKLNSKDYTYYTIILSNLAAIHIQQKEYDEAFEILLNAEKKLIKLGQEQFLPHIYNSLGANYEMAKPNLDSAAYYYQKSLDVSLKLNKGYMDNLTASVSSHNLGKLYFKQKEYTKALKYFKTALDLSNGQAKSKFSVGMYESLSQTYDSIGDIKSAYFYKKLQYKVNNEIFNIESKKAIEELEIKYQTQHKELQIQQQQKEIEKAKNQRNRIIFSSISLLMLIFFVVYVILNRRKTLRLFQQEKIKLFENIIHEIKTPLTLIHAPLKLLKKDAPIQLHDNIQLIENNTQKLIRLTEELFDVSKLDKGEYEYQYKIGNVDDFIKNILSNYQLDSKLKEITIQFESNNSSQQYSYPSNAIDKIISNLVSNSLKYNPKGTTISLHSTIENHCLKLEVKDNGIGIPKEEQKKIFDRFYRGKSTKDVGGTGIGLSLVYDLIQLVEGRLSFTSELNLGTCFLVEIPLKPVTLQAKIDSNNSKPLLLIAEDNNDISQFVKSILDDSFEIILKSNGLDAEESIHEILPDIILSDVIMPQKGGIELLQSVKSNALTQHIPVVLFSAKSSLESKLEGLEHGADAYIPKPFSPTELKLILQNLSKTILNSRREFQDGIKNQSEKTFDQRIKSKDKYVNESIDKIIQNIENPDYSVNELAADMYVSRSQLHRKITMLTGFSTTKFIRMVRLEKAKDMLLSNEGNITEVAYSCGFNSQSYFTKSFTDYFGESPSNFLKTEKQ